MLKPNIGLPSPRGLAAALLLLTPLSFGQSAQDDFYQAYYLHHEVGNLQAAAPLYQSVIKSMKKGDPLASQAREALQDIHEDLFAADFARLMPTETILFIELGHPGQQLRQLSEELGLLAEGDKAGGMGISPRLFDSALDVRGAAVSITAIDPQGGPPNGVLVLHPGDQNSLRGLIETAIGNGGERVDDIEGAPTWSMEGEAFVTQTRRLVIASPDRALISGVIQRLNGKDKTSFADAQSLQSARRAGADDLLFFHLRAEPVLPQLQAILREQAKHDPELAMGMAFMDIKSLVGVSGRLGVDDRGLGLQLGLELKEGHKNLAFNLLRLPAIKGSTIEHVPEGVAFLVAGALNERADVAPASGEEGRPIVTALDFGREFFANVVDVCFYGLPGESAGPIPDVALSIRVNNVERSRALWKFVLGMASQSSGAESMESTLETIDGVEVERYVLQGLPVYLYAGDHELLITPSRAALTGTLNARANGRSVLADPLLGPALKHLGEGTNLAVLASPGRLVKMAEAHIPAHEREQVMMAAGVLQDTVVSLGLRQTNTQLGLSLEVSNLPDVSPLIAQLRAQERQRAQQHVAHSAPVASEAKGKRSKKGSKDPQKLFQAAVQRGDKKAANTALKSLAKTMMDDATELNNLAWALLTEDEFGGKFNEQAIHLSERSNELTEYSNWMFLDTLALAEFKDGNVERAIELETMALKFVEGTGREKEVKQALKKFKAATRKPSRKTSIGAR